MISTTTPQTHVALPQAPYRGIEAFRYIDYPIFFAREKETRLLLRFITIYRALLLYGDSGTGKSSLINAGLIRAAINDGFAPERLRVRPRENEEISVERISTTAEGGAPFLDSIFDPNQDNLSAKDFLRKLRAFKRQDNIALPGSIPLLIFDQFEEFITLFEEAPREEQAKVEARKLQESILEALVQLIDDQSLCVKVLFVFREDYLAKFSKLFARLPGLQHQSIRLPPLQTEALHDIIRGPFDSQKIAQKLKGDFGNQADVKAQQLVQTFRNGGNEISENLAAELIEDVSGSIAVNLSELQIACQSLWSKKESVAIFRENGVGALLEEYLTNALGQLPEDLRDPAMALLSQMVIPPTTRNVISEFTLLEQVRDEETFEEDLLSKALEALVADTKIVRRESRNTPFYELISEFLVPWIVRQKVLREERVRQLKLIEESREREKVARQKKRRTVVLSIAILSAVVLALLVWYLYSINTRLSRALEEKDIAEGEVRIRTEKVLQNEIVQGALRDKEQATQEAQQAKAAAETAKQEADAAKQQADQATQQINNLTQNRDYWRDRARALENAIPPSGNVSGQAPISVAQWIAYVKWIKSSLNLLEGANLNDDGIYDGRTREAVKRFQRHNNLLDDGIAGAATMAKINELRGNR